MAEGGAFFFLDLGAPDATYILPCAAAVTFLGVTEIGMDGMKMQVTPVMKWVFRLLPIGFLPLSADLPSACLLYWCSSNTFSMMQTLFMRNKAVKKWLMIPEVPEQVRPSCPLLLRILISSSQSCTPLNLITFSYEAHNQYTSPSHQVNRGLCACDVAGPGQGRESLQEDPGYLRRVEAVQGHRRFGDPVRQAATPSPLRQQAGRPDVRTPPAQKYQGR